MIMDNRQIEERIAALTKELLALEESHNAMVKQNQQATQEFGQKVAKNQTRYAQIQGALVELKQLIKTKGNNNDNSIPTPSRSHRAANVRVSE
jgi:hypothetical protein